MATKPVDAPSEPEANTGRMSRGQLSPDRTRQDSANKAQQKAERKLIDEVPEPLLSSEVNPPDHLSIILDVGGKKFRTTRATLMKLPNTRLGRLVQEKGQLRKNSGMVEFFFDRNPKMMNSVLDLYRKGELHLPSSMCYSLVEEELEFWEIPVELMSACCWKKFKQHQNLKDAMAEMHKLFQASFPEAVVKGATSWRLRLWNMLQFSFDSLASKIWSFVFFIFVFMSIFNFIVETDPYFRVPTDKFRRYLDAHNTTLTETYNEVSPVHYMVVTFPDTWQLILRYITIAFFVLDFMLRLVTCPMKKKFFKEPRNWLEMVIFTKTILHFVMEKLVYSKETEEVSHGEKSVTVILYALSAVRVLRILYLGNVFPDLKTVYLCFKTSLKDLLLMFTCAITFALLFATLAYMSEMLCGHQTFNSIFHATWWSIITMTTVGYGDVHPRCLAGKLVGSLCALSGVVVLALPIAVIANNFYVYHSNICMFQYDTDRGSFLKEKQQFSISHDAGQHIDGDKNDDSDADVGIGLSPLEGGKHGIDNDLSTRVSRKSYFQMTGDRESKKGQSHIKPNQVCVSSTYASSV